MLQFNRFSVETLNGFVNDFFARNLVLTNYFGVDLKDVDCIKTEHSLLIRKPYINFYRLYIMSDDEDDLITVLKDVDKNHAINIPTKNGITKWDDALTKSGFYQFAIYDRHRNSKPFVKRGEFIELWANESDCAEVKKLLFDTFSPITGWLPNNNELLAMIINHQVMVIRDESGISGVFIFTINNKKCELNAWVSLRGQGLDLFLNALNLLAEQEIKIVYAWINRKNINVRKMYRRFGFIADGLIDYTYLK